MVENIPVTGYIGTEEIGYTGCYGRYISQASVFGTRMLFLPCFYSVDREYQYQHINLLDAN
jgi:hypothetical protein